MAEITEEEAQHILQALIQIEMTASLVRRRLMSLLGENHPLIRELDAVDTAVGEISRIVNLKPLPTGTSFLEYQ